MESKNVNCEKEWFGITILVREGKNLEKKLMGSSSPFVEVIMGNESKRTKTASNLNNAVWDERLIFKYGKLEDIPSSILVKVKDENTLLPNAFLGDNSIKIDKEMLVNRYQQQATIVLHEGLINLLNCSQGELNFEVKFQYFDEMQQQSQKEQEPESEKRSQESIPQNEMKDEKIDIAENHPLKDEKQIAEQEQKINLQDDKPVQDENAISDQLKDLHLEREAEFMDNTPVARQLNQELLNTDVQQPVAAQMQEKDVPSEPQQMGKNELANPKEQDEEIDPQ